MYHPLRQATLHIASTIAVLSISAYAWSDPLPLDLQFHGFASQSVIKTNSNNFFGNTEDNGNFDFTEFGLNVSSRPSSNLLLAAQGIFRRAGEGHNSDTEIDYALLDYRLITNDTLDLGFRAGRIKNPIGLYNDTRDIAFTRPSIILPQSIYFDRVRRIILSADGVHLYGEYRKESGFLTYQIGAAKPRVSDRDTELALLGGNRPGDLDGATSFVGRIIYDWDGGRSRFSLSGLQVNLDYSPGNNDPSDSGDITFSELIFSFQYNAENWIYTSEYARREFEYSDIIYSPEDNFQGESYYFQGQYKLSSRWWGLLRYDVTYTDISDKSGKEFETKSRGTRPAYSRFAKDWTLGLRWDINSSWMVSAEHHWVNGTAWLPTQDNPDPLETEKNWRMFMLLGAYRF